MPVLTYVWLKLAWLIIPSMLSRLLLIKLWVKKWKWMSATLMKVTDSCQYLFFCMCLIEFFKKHTNLEFTYIWNSNYSESYRLLWRSEDTRCILAVILCFREDSKVALSVQNESLYWNLFDLQNYAIAPAFSLANFCLHSVFSSEASKIVALWNQMSVLFHSLTSIGTHSSSHFLQIC